MEALSDKEVLQKVFGISCKNGHYILVRNDFDWDKYIKNHQYKNVIFSFDFAKAFWGEGKKLDFEFDDFGNIAYEYSDGSIYRMPEWKYHLQQIVIAEDKIEYLREFLD